MRRHSFAAEKPGSLMSIKTIERRELLQADLGRRHTTSVDVRRIEFEPGQQTGRHSHPCPVVGYILEGSAEFQIEGKPVQHLPAGSAFYEPAETVIARFDNASDANPMAFVAMYLLDGKQELITMLEGA
jgi:quercetin dioxygenase-like cupin family protein